MGLLIFRDVSPGMKRRIQSNVEIACHAESSPRTVFDIGVPGCRRFPPSVLPTNLMSTPFEVAVVAPPDLSECKQYDDNCCPSVNPG